MSRFEPEPHTGALDEVDLAHLWYELGLDKVELPAAEEAPARTEGRRGAMWSSTALQRGSPKAVRADWREVVLHRLYRALVARRATDRDPLSQWLGDHAARPTVRVTAGRLARKTSLRARAAAAPVALSVALATFALVRLPSANTLWYEELSITSNVSTLESFCDPPELTFVEAVTLDGKTTFTYALSGDGDGLGPGCLPHDISNIYIEVCFNPELVDEDDGGRVLSTDEPANWEYSPKNAGSPKQVKWDWGVFVENKGPWDPEVHRFSFTLDVETAAMLTSNAYYKAGPTTAALGEVQVPACPLPEPPEELAAPLFAPSFVPESIEDTTEFEEETPETELIEEATLEPEPTVEEEPIAMPGPAIISGEPTRAKPTATPTPKPVAISIPPKKK